MGCGRSGGAGSGDSGGRQGQARGWWCAGERTRGVHACICARQCVVGPNMAEARAHPRMHTTSRAAATHALNRHQQQHTPPQPTHQARIFRAQRDGRHRRLAEHAVRLQVLVAERARDAELIAGPHAGKHAQVAAVLRDAALVFAARGAVAVCDVVIVGGSRGGGPAAAGGGDGGR